MPSLPLVVYVLLSWASVESSDIWKFSSLITVHQICYQGSCTPSLPLAAMYVCMHISKRQASFLISLGIWNEPGSREENTTPCIVVIVPGSVGITYRTHFNWISQTYLTFKILHGFIYYIIRRIAIRIFEYKPLGLKENKQESGSGN